MSGLVRWPLPAPSITVASRSRLIAPPAVAASPPSGLVELVQENDGNVGGTRQTSVTVTTIGGLAAGNLVTVELTSNNVPTFTPPADGTWTSIKREVSGTSHVAEAFRHQVQAGEVGAPGSWVFSVGATTRSICWHVGEWADVDLTGPIDGTPTSVVAGTTSVAVPSMTVGDGAAVVIATAHSSGAGAFITVTEPSGFTELVDQHTTTAQTESSEHVSWESFPTGGATGTITATASGSGAVGIGYALKAAPAGGGQTIAAGQALETEAGQAVGRRKTAAAAQATEVEAAQAITPRKTAALQAATETEAARALGRVKTRAIGEATEPEAGQPIAVGQAGPQIVPAGQAGETETAQTITPRKARALGQATEAEAGQAVGARKTRAIIQATEVEAGQPVGRAKTRTVIQAIEPEASQAVGRRKTAAVSPAVEAEAAQTINLLGEQIIPVGRAVEAEVAAVVGRVKTRALAVAAEAEAARALARLKLATVGAALEAEAGLLVTVAGGLPPPRWVEHTGGGSGLTEAAGGGSGLTEAAGGGSGVIEATGGV